MGKGCNNCLRIVVVIINVLFLLIGLALLGGALYLYFNSTMQSAKSIPDMQIPIDVTLFVLMGIGGLTVLVSSFGCCGAYHESCCVLSTYLVFLLLIVGAEVAGGVIVYIKRNDDSIKQSVMKSMQSTIANMNGTIPDSIVRIQQALECCGANGTEYSNKTMDSTCRKGEKIYTQGCVDKVFEMLNNKGYWLLIGIGSIAGLELLTILLALCVCCRRDNDDEGYVGVSAD